MINNGEAEKAIIAAVLSDGRLFEQLQIRPEQFSFPTHKYIFEAMVKLDQEHVYIDSVTVGAKLGEGLNRVGGRVFLEELSESAPDTEALQHHEKLIYEAYKNKMIKSISEESAENPDHKKLNEIIKSLEELSGLGLSEEESSFYDHLKAIAQEIGEVKDIGQMGFKTGFRDYDQITGGLQRSDLVVVGARASMGKTAFGLNVAMGHCENGGTSHIFSLEMPTRLLIRRLINMVGGIDSSSWFASTFSTEDYHKAMSAIEIMSKWNMKIHENSNKTADMVRIMRKEVRDNPEERHIAVVDYLGMIKTDSFYSRKDLEVEANAQDLKDLAKELDIPIILLVQLNRGVEHRQEKRPVMSDLKDSGGTEQIADIVILLYREDYYDTESENKNKIEIIIEKARNGPRGTVELQFIKRYGRFANLDFKPVDR